MNIKTALFAFVTMGLIGSLTAGTGCGKNDCEDASDRILAKYDECEVPTGDGEDGDAVEVDCTDELGTQQQNLASCIEAASCEVVTVSGDTADEAYLEALTTYSDCVTAA
jgi:hypothetical protein